MQDSLNPGRAVGEKGIKRRFSTSNCRETPELAQAEGTRRYLVMPRARSKASLKSGTQSLAKPGIISCWLLSRILS